MEGVTSVFKNRDGGVGFDWKSVKEGGIVADVGGGFGSATMIIARQHPHLKFVIQDREPVVEQAKGVRTINLLKLTWRILTISPIALECPIPRSYLLGLCRPPRYALVLRHCIPSDFPA